MARPTLPRLRRGRAPGAGDVAERTEPRISELAADGLTWVHADRPGEAEVAYLADRFGFHELDIEDVLSKRQRPKIDEYPDYLFLVLQFPFYDKTVQRLNAAELDVFIGQDFLITLPNVELLPVTYLLRRCQDDPERREELFSKGSGYLLYHILDDLFDYCFPILDKIGTKLDAIEGAIFEERSEEVVRDISNAKQEIIAYRKIIKPERATLRLLERSTLRFLPENLELYFDDIVDASERIWDLLDNYKEVIDGLESTNESFISHKQQYRLQLLTVVSVTLLPLTLLASVFGMNVGVPGFVVVNRFPYASGHLMVAGYRHEGEFGALDADEALEIHRLASTALGVLAETMRPQGFNLGWNLGRIAGAGIVDHVHLHVVPRWAGDTNFMPVLADVKVMPEALEATRRKLADAWP